MTLKPGSVSRAGSKNDELLSNTTILILSAFLIGMFAQRLAPPIWNDYLLLIGAAGLVSYLGLGLVARSRRLETIQESVRNTCERLENRFDQHAARSLQSY